MGLNKKKVIISQSLDDWAYLLWVDKAEKVHPREKPLLLLLPAFDKSLVALDGEEAPLVEVGGGPPPWVESVQDFFCKLVMKLHMNLVETCVFSLHHDIDLKDCKILILSFFCPKNQWNLCSVKKY